jgi:signal transduction histidine kinase
MTGRHAWRPVALVVAVVLAGAAGTLAVGALLGMDRSELVHLGALLVPAALATVVATAVAGPLLSRTTIRARFLAVAVIAAVASLVNLFVLSALMIVSSKDAALIGTLLLYSMGAGVGAAWALGRSSAQAVGRLAETARSLGDGDLDARVGPVRADHELESLGRTLDDMADRVQAAMAAERAAEATRRDLITAVSHDLRTPLASLRAMVEAIDDRVVDDPPTLQRYAAEMRRSVDALVQLVDDLFELAKLDAGAIQAERTRAKLADVVGSAVAACGGEAASRGLKVCADLGDAGEAPCSPRLVRVLQNLLANAIQHTPADGTVRIEARRPPVLLEVSVADTGRGIDPEALPRVFEPFFRGDPARSGPGSGLGLALAKRIVEALGGSIRAESDPGRGARFALEVPDGR